MGYSTGEPGCAGSGVGGWAWGAEDDGVGDSEGAGDAAGVPGRLSVGRPDGVGVGDCAPASALRAMIKEDKTIRMRISP